jgi:hypothetical protein
MRIISIGILLSGGILGIHLVSGAQNAKQITILEIDKEQVVKEAKKLIVTRERVGKELIAIVDDVNHSVDELIRSIMERLEAARLLGKLQYQPAIDVLIRHVDLADPTYVASESRLDRAYPITLALANYGPAAIPKVVDSCLLERNGARRFLLRLSIRLADQGRNGENISIALRYVRGIEPPDEKDSLRRQNLEEIEKGLKSLKETDFPADREKN